MEGKVREVRIYVSELGVEPYTEWIRALKDVRGRSVIRIRVDRLEQGSFSKCEPVGEGVHEQKIDFGPGYRVYFGMDGDQIILLIGGDKNSQSKDIVKAKEYWSEYNA